MREAKDKLPYLPSEPYRNQIELKPVPITSPLAGRVVAVHVAPRQFVAAVVVRAHPDHRRDPQELGRLLVDSPAGDKIPLSAVAQISVEPAPNGINHERE